MTQQLQQQPLSTQRVKPALRDLIDQAIREAGLTINCHALGTVISFNPLTQTCQASINYTRSFRTPDPYGNPQILLMPYPVLVDVPVVFLRGGPAGLTFPVAAGDLCEIHFNDRDIDNWFALGATGAGCATQRTHALSDGIAIVGLASGANPMANFDTTHAVLFYGATKVAVGAKVLVKNAAGKSLNDVLQDLSTQLQNLIVQLETLTVTGVSSGGSTSGVPTNAVAFATIGTNLTAVAAEISALLE